jgi:hypothetical protein
MVANNSIPPTSAMSDSLSRMMLQRRIRRGVLSFIMEIENGLLATRKPQANLLLLRSLNIF